MLNLPYLVNCSAVRRRHLRMKFGDKVRSIGGVEGEIFSRGVESHSVTVKVPGSILCSQRFFTLAAFSPA
jgi:hypothetical protein